VAFVETVVCSLIYKFAFLLTAYGAYISQAGQGDMAMSDRACLDLLPGLNTAVRKFDCLQILHSLLFDGQFIEIGGSGK
jgi:hypothetical protein